MFKRFYYMVYSSFFRIPFWIFAFALLLPLYGIQNNYMITTGNFWESTLTSQFLFTLWIPIGVLILLSKVGISRLDDATRYVRMKNRRTIIAVNSISSFFMVLIYVFVALLILILYAKLKWHLSLVNQWSDVTINSLQYNDEGTRSNTLAAVQLVENFTPVTAFLVSLPFMLAYYWFLALLSTAINTAFKAPFGSAFCGLAILSKFILQPQDMSSYSLVPDYNSRLSSVLYSTDPSIVKPHAYIAPIIYWAVLLTLSIVIYYFAMRKADLISQSRDGDK